MYLSFKQLPDLSRVVEIRHDNVAWKFAVEKR